MSIRQVRSSSAAKARWEDPFSAEGQREATAKILTGSNYRLFFEGVTRRNLINTYRELSELANSHPGDDEAWRNALRQAVEGKDKNLRYWLVGLTTKTATNLGYKVSDLPKVFEEVMDELAGEVDMGQRDTALLLWAGAATLTIRGSQKSKVGKRLEKSIARAALTVIGLNEERGDFRLNIAADDEVTRETDAEIKTQRGWLRMEVGLIGQGNPEVISDKVGRMGRNGVILMDFIPPKSTAYDTAAQHQVQLIQMRNNNPVEKLRSHLHRLKVPVQEKPISTAQVERRVLKMPARHFGEITS